MAKLDSTRILAGRMFCKTRGNARKRNIEVAITLEDVHGMMLAQDMRCALTNIKFDTEKRVPGVRIRPYLPSVDRIDASRGYFPDNIRIVCAAANYALGDWGEEIFGQIALGFCHRHGLARVVAKRSLPEGVVARPEDAGIKYEALISWRGKRYYLGRFATSTEAGEFYETVKRDLRQGGEIHRYLPSNWRKRRAIPSGGQQIDGVISDVPL